MLGPYCVPGSGATTVTPSGTWQPSGGLYKLSIKEATGSNSSDRNISSSSNFIIMQIDWQGR